MTDLTNPPRYRQGQTDTEAALASAAALVGKVPMPHQAASVATDVPTLVTDFNALLTKLQTAGLMAAS